MQGTKRLLSTKAINMSLLPTTQNILFPSFTPIPGRYFHMENSVWSLAAYQLIWATTCIAGTCTSMEGTLIFPWPKPNCWNKTEQQLMLLWLAISTLQWHTADGETLRAQLYEERRVAVVAGSSSGTTEPLSSTEHVSVQCLNENWVWLYIPGRSIHSIESWAGATCIIVVKGVKKWLWIYHEKELQSLNHDSEAQALKHCPSQDAFSFHRHPGCPWGQVPIACPQTQLTCWLEKQQASLDF